MSWGDALQAVLDVLHADAQLQADLGAGFRIRNAGEVEDAQIPGMIYSIQANTESEVWESVAAQFSIWTRDTAIDPAIVISHRIQLRLRRILHRETYHEDFGGVPMSSKVTNTSQGDDPETGVVQFDVDVELQTLRSKYPLGSTSS